ncbi:MAG TPA: anaerobic C4-dicarboxylate transporter family protein [Thermoanaerobaculales bacterium]|nr:anaerobic C4-dicarboxylate transporter family protein [Thermoanaerobaculales bacterium]HPA80313.1 anaerobic C4-dicarboxylate transporter family protein [Thermoanaerobaculales bacterium]HQL29500.1 anaerobic C4-dicarboxylate transporter family protein [Thermoanaerobaculales bacterium]HQN95143.1 anaerobic C4-dicarboxylate transporter family protein [Thermoanaerobaculales bacterium]HQP43192.1 anaerobic C4-dicarboxylate transporter family protein [Thermoanaerobaculales bacterium]
MLLWIELALLLACVVVGSRIGGIGLGITSGIGLFVFVFVLGLPPGSPPATVLGMILAVISALSLLEAAGGLDYVIRGAERLLRRNPKGITFLAPLVTYALVLASGTQHVIYALLPVIAEVARKAGVRPERPMSMSVIASQQGLVASPISAATVALIGGLASAGVSLPKVLLVIIPATLLGVLAGTLSVAFRGRELADDPEYQRRLAEGIVAAPAAAAELGAAEKRRALGACVVFLLAVAAVVLLGLFPGLRPVYETVSEGAAETGQIDMGRAIMVVMLAAAGLLAILFRASPEKAIKGGVMKGGLTAIICILGVSWMGSSFFEANQATIVGGISDVIRAQPWVFALGLFALSILLFSQAATVVTLLPVGVALGLPLPLLVGTYPAVNGNFFLPTYGTVLAAVAFDTTGTTKIGKYLLNHSFMRPGLVASAVSVVAALVLAQLVF